MLDAIMLWTGIFSTAAAILFIGFWAAKGRRRDEPTLKDTSPEGRAKRAIRWIIVLAWAASTIPGIIQNSSNARRASAVIEGGSATQLSSLAAYGTALLLIVVCVAQICTAKTVAQGRRFTGVALVLLPWVIAILSSVITGSSIPYNAVALPTAALALWRLNAKIDDLVPVAWLTGLTATIAVAMGVLLPSRGLLHGESGNLSTADKAIIGDTLLAGPFNHSNQLGVVLALGLPAILLLTSKSAKFWLFSVTVLAMAWSASRGSLTAAGIAVGIVLCVGLFRSGPTRRGWARLSVLACAGAVAYVPLTTDTLAAFSDRGQIWAASIEAWAEAPTFGNGYSWYGEIAKFANNLTAVAFNGHNLFVHSLVTGGVVLVFVLSLLALRLTSVAAWEADKGNLFALAYAVSFFIIAVLEVPTRFRDIDPLSWVAVVPLIVIAMQAKLDTKGPSPLAARASLQRLR